MSDGASTRTVHDVLRHLILDGALQPGSEISQLELSRQLSVSRTPLREALRLLEREGLVVNVGPHRAIRVSELSMVDLDDLYSLRVLGEGLAIWLTVPTLRADDLERLEQDLSELTATGDPLAHMRFHAGLRTGGGERLREHLERLFEHADRYQRAFFTQPDTDVAAGKLAEHRAILDACIERDRERARALLVDHIAGTAIALMTAERHAPFSLLVAVEMAKAGLA
jgi:DNA-binding GntR family transcriptional regulator